MAVKDDWVKAAMTDDTVVVELLVRLKEAWCSASIKPAEGPARARMELPPPGWGIRQPRTRLAFKCEVASPAKGGNLTRNSPTTPLSWSAGTASSSGTGDCYEDSDLPSGGSSRSKVIVVNDSTSSPNKKLKRKKTLAELKDEESLLLRERIHLNKELAVLNATFVDQRVRNENLKRMKLNFNAQILKSTAHAMDEQPYKVTCSAQSQIDMSSLYYGSWKQLPPHAPSKYPPSDVPVEPKPFGKGDTCFELPDLNLMPCEDDMCS
ncbi:hypothetical protein SAY86_031036 [Trapa natans]|uniref:Uncharacterized protein n=1 Tax=Trapa natans TaxID=22666 RepID=A0AAN7RE31_TRANT|nr:hypothetical protein SAY86_031036 [Trapa natans]